MPNSEFHHHDHFKCVEDALQALQAHCAVEGLKFTPLRKRVFEILLEEHKAPLAPMIFWPDCAKKALAPSLLLRIGIWIFW